jgi:hypothetical protein
LSLACAAPLAHGQAIPAFSGADGAARYVSGGRGGIVYKVTKLNSAIDDPQRNDPGTIRYGLNNANFPANTPRTIVFDVGGVFHLGRLDQATWQTNGNGWDAQSRLTIGGTNITLAGQTAPGRGVIFMGGGLKPQGTNNIIRNVTVASGYGMTGWYRPGDPMRAVPGTPEAGTDAASWYPDNVVYDAMDIAAANGLMIDHVSTLYGTDETISMNETAFNVTVQYSNISQGQNYPQWDAEGGGLTGHALGSLLSAGGATQAAAVSFHHNLYAHQKGRVPQMQGGLTGGYYDFRNNVFYNWLGTAGSKAGTTYLNLVNNFYLAGPGGDNPAGGTSTAINQSSGGTGVLSASSTIYRNGNLLDSNKDGDALDGVTLSAGGAASPLWMGGVDTYFGTTDTPTAALDRVLNYVGANWWTRDSVIDTPDERIINETRTGTGKIRAWADDPWNNDPNEGTEWRALWALRPDPTTGAAPFNRPADWDVDSDGMPGAWEVRYGLDPNVADNNGDFDSDGYTNLEEYLNDIAAWPAPNAIVFNAATNERWAQITNWDANPNAAKVDNWQPSRFDTAQINAGTVVVDAVGQDAFYVQIGAVAGSGATLSVTDGWLLVRTDVEVGSIAGSTGATVSLSGGKLIIGGTLRGGAGTGQSLSLTGGTLVANAIDATKFGGTITNNGTRIAPGDTGVAGRTTVTGAYAATNGASLHIDLGGATAATTFQTTSAAFDRLNVTGTATIDGTLALQVINGYDPAYGTSHAFIVAGARTGKFDSITGVQLSADKWLAVTYSATGATITAALPGDVDLNGAVNFDDLLKLAASYNSTSGADWSLADFDGNGRVNFDDLLTLASHYNQSVPSGSWALALTAVPEPGAVVCAAAMALTLRRGRRAV